jgi:hypothetical protein
MSGAGPGEAAPARVAERDRRRYLVLANQTIESPALQTLIEQRAAAPGATFHLVVPATRISDQQQALVASEHLRSVGSEDASVALARHRLDRALARLRRRGVEVSGDVGDPDPCDAFREALRAYDADALPDEIIVSTLPARLSRWVASGLVRRIRRECSVPVTHVEARPSFLAALRNGRSAVASDAGTTRRPARVRAGTTRPR